MDKEILKMLREESNSDFVTEKSNPFKGLGRSGETKRASPSPWSRDD